jgi:hypothetical protein
VIDPRLRQRVEVVPVRATVKADVTNEEILSSFLRAVDGKVAAKTREAYGFSIRDAMRYFRTPEGAEVPVRSWSKQEVWAYFHFIETNYCASFASAHFKPGEAVCRQRVWIGSKVATEALRADCAGCSLFKRPTVMHRLNALNKFYKYLARLGVVEHNFLADIVSEYYEENPARGDRSEKRRNPSVEDEVKLVNGTAHPQRRAFYACSAKWWLRPNEMLMLDRYASFGLAAPEGASPAKGFERGFQAHQQLASFADGGDVVYLPETKGALDKRKGNRWVVIDAELRPLLEQVFAWWEKTVKRDAAGAPVTTSLWLSPGGCALKSKDLYPAFFIEDAIRLGIMRPEERHDPKRVWTAHCQRHFGEKLLEMHNVPDAWCNHFRGDAFHDARGHYFKPTPEQVRQKYHELVPMLGFQPLPDAARLRRGTGSERDAHRAILTDELAKMRSIESAQVDARCAILVCPGEEFVVPRRVAPSFVYAARIAFAETVVELRPDHTGDLKRGRCLSRRGYEVLLERALGWLS